MLRLTITDDRDIILDTIELEPEIARSAEEFPNDDDASMILDLAVEDFKEEIVRCLKLAVAKKRKELLRMTKKTMAKVD